ncbi:hypothetical protein [Cupriavidus necator]
MTTYRYEIHPRPAELGGGWRLRLLEDDLEVEADRDVNPRRGLACGVSGSARPAGFYIHSLAGLVKQSLGQQRA